MKLKKQPPVTRSKTPAFVARAERAFRRAEQQVRADYAKAGLPLVFWKGNRVCLVSAR
jgi:hypothetical protein